MGNRQKHGSCYIFEICKAEGAAKKVSLKLIEMIVFLILNGIAILINLFGASMYIGPPGLQYILIYLTVPAAFILSLFSILSIRKSKRHIYIVLLFSVITLLTGLPLWLEHLNLSGTAMRTMGRVCCGIGIPIQIILLYLAWRGRNKVV